MIKVSVFNKTNDVLIVDTFKNVFQRRSSEVFKPGIPEFPFCSAESAILALVKIPMLLSVHNPV